MVCRIVTNLQNTLSERHRPSKEMLLQPLPLDLLQSYTKDFKRTISMAASTSSGKPRSREGADESASLSPLPSGGVPSSLPPALPAAFPATPTGAARQLQHLHFGDRDSSSSTSSNRVSTGPLRPSGLSITSMGSSGAPSPASVVAAERLRDIQQVIGDGKKFETGGLFSLTCASGPQHMAYILQCQCSVLNTLLIGCVGVGVAFSLPIRLYSFCKRHTAALLCYVSAAISGAQSPSSSRPSLVLPRTSSAAGIVGGSGPHSPSTPNRSSLTGTAGSFRPMGLGLKVTLPPETELELCGSSDSFCYSPTTPVPKPGIKERMKFYFQRQAGGAGGL